MKPMSAWLDRIRKLLLWVRIALACMLCFATALAAALVVRAAS